jgi:hypothetical protein
MHSPRPNFLKGPLVRIEIITPMSSVTPSIKENVSTCHCDLPRSGVVWAPCGQPRHKAFCGQDHLQEGKPDFRHPCCEFLLFMARNTDFSFVKLILSSQNKGIFLSSRLTFKRSYKSILWGGGVHISTAVRYIHITPRGPATLEPESPTL